MKVPFRVLAAGLVFAAALAAFVLPWPEADHLGGLVASFQLFPAFSSFLAAALEGFAGAAVGTWVFALAVFLLSFVFGRWYCAALCPLGTLQDLALLARKAFKGKKFAFAEASALPRLLAASAAFLLLAAGAAAAASWLDPWSLFGRFASRDLKAVFLAAAGEDLDGFGLWDLAAPALAVVFVLTLAALRGRWFCGTLCPVGTVLGLANRFAPFRLRLDEGACVSCGACASVCPASCLDPAGKRFDAGRCVYCLACVAACPSGALRYGRAAASRPAAAAASPGGLSRARFLAALGGGAAMLLAALPARSLFAGLRAEAPPSIPPGAKSLDRFLTVCTACGLCAGRCPSKVLQPSLGQLGARGLFVPRLDYELSYCQYECTSCLDVCPSGALRRMTPAEKKREKIGDATLVRDLCIVIKNKTKCGACAERCPTGAVRMVEVPSGLPEPIFTSSICIGCGACHNACPVKPKRAITVEGLDVHRKAEAPTKDLFDLPGGGKKVESGGSPAKEGPAKDEKFPF